MSDNIYDILGKLNGLAPKENPVSTAEPIYESIDPRGDIITAVTQLEERYQGFKEAKKTKRREPEATIPASDLTRSADPDVARLATKAKFIKPELNDFEAIVSYTSKLEKELEQAEKADVVDRQKIEQNQQMLAKTQANQDRMQKVITATDQRFRALNDKVAAGKITQQDQQAAVAAQQIEKDHDAQVAAVAQGQEIPTKQAAAPEVPEPQAKDSNIYDFPDKKTTAKAGAELQDQPPAGTVTTPQGSNLAALTQPVTPLDLPEPENEPQFFKQAESKLREGFWKTKDIENQELAAQAPQQPTTPEQYVAVNKQQVARFDADPKLQAVPLQYPNGAINITRATYDKVAKGLSKIGDKILKNRVETDIFSNREQLAKYMNDIASAPGVDYYYFYNVQRGQEAKAVNIGLKQSKNGNWYYPRMPLPAAEEIFGKGIKWTPGQSAKTTAESLQQNLGNPSMKNLEKIAESLMERFANFKEAAKPDFLDLDKDGDTEEPMKSAAKDAKEHEPAKVDKSAVEKRKRLQALKDKQEDERAEKDDYDTKSSSRFVKGRAYGGAAQKDDEEKDLDESGLQAYLGKKKYGKEGMKALQKAGREGASKEKMALIRAKHDKMDEAQMDEVSYSAKAARAGKDIGKPGKAFAKIAKSAGERYGSKERGEKVAGAVLAKLRHGEELDEVAPPGAKAERMVKHIKKGYAKDGKLTKKEKGIAYATAWKAKKAGKLEESRNHESSEYTYETVGRILSEEQPHLDCNSEAFVKAVYDELIELKMTPKAARWLCHYDEDFLSDTATSYNHFCDSKNKEMAECGSPMNAFVSEEPLLDAQQELDEIAKLAGLPAKMESKCSSCGCADCECTESLNPMVPGDSASPLTHTCAECGMMEDQCSCTKESMVDESAINEAATRKDFRMVADLLKAIPDMAKRTELALYHADIFKQQNSRFKKEMFLAAAGVDTTPIKDESVETEGNAFTGKLADTPKGDEFELDGKKFKDTSDLEEEMETEGNEFSGALAKAKAAGEKEFEVDGKKYTVKEDINLNVSATGEEDVVSLIRKLSGMPVVAIQAQPAVAEEVVAEEGPKERDVEYTNTPRELVAPSEEAYPPGTDLNRAKKQFKKEYPGDNPMAVAEAKEESLWRAYETMINDVKA